MNPVLKRADQLLWRYLEHHEFKGWDPFDGLNSALFGSSPLNRSRLCRLAWLQFFKRCPINLRPVAKVPKGENPKGLALLASASLLRGNRDQADGFLERLGETACSSREEWCWGYNFTWQARAFHVPLGTPNMVTSVFVANAFLDRFEIGKREEDLEKARGVCRFIVNELLLQEDADTACFAYIPGESARVHNANMLGAALLARTAALSGSDRLLPLSEKAMRYSVLAMGEDGSWPYGERRHHRFVDNFHTAYNLVSLNDWMAHAPKPLWEDALKRGLRHYLRVFWLKDGTPKYYDTNTYPIDSHCSAMGIAAAAKLANLIGDNGEFAERTALWVVRNMQNEDGSFSYQRHRSFTNRIPYMRWTQCWMAYGLAHLTAPPK